MKEYLQELRKRMYIGMVGGSNLAKQIVQLGDDGKEKRFFFILFWRCGSNVEGSGGSV